MSYLIDTHAHLDMYEDWETVFAEAQAQGVKKVVIPSVEAQYFKKLVDISNSKDDLYCMMGIFPTEAKTWKDSYSDEMEEFAKNNKVVAIGEIGLDYYWDKTFVEEQKKSFERQIKISQELNLPILIHDREAHFDTFEMVKEIKDIPVVMHCFSGSLDFAKQCIEKGFYIAFGGVLTFKNAKKMKEVAKNIPMEYILIETDAPYLTPEPYRGKENHPAYVKFVAEQLANLREMAYEDVVKITNENAKRIFKF